MNEKKYSNIVNTPYDDVFRTLLNDCSSLIINEIFQKHYKGDEKNRLYVGDPLFKPAGWLRRKADHRYLF